MMYTVVLTIFVLVSIAMTITVLLQQGKGADIGAVFGGSSQTVFGSSGAGNFLTKLTAVLAAIFFAAALYLDYFSTARLTGSIFDRPGANAPAKAAPARRVPIIPAPAAPAPASRPAPGH
jgi:preprotein translocase subunit SecG